MKIMQTTRELVKKAKEEGFARLSVAALIRTEKGVLVLRRKVTDSLPGQYVMPGGGVKHGETLEQALAREVFEETGLFIISIDRYLGSTDLVPARNSEPIRKFNFAVTADECKIRLTEHDHYVWVTRESMCNYNIVVTEIPILKNELATHGC